MGKSKTVKTPVGKINVGPNATPSAEATTTIREMKTEFIKVAKRGTVPVERLRDDTTKYLSS